MVRIRSSGYFLAQEKGHLAYLICIGRKKTEVQAKGCVAVHCQSIVPLEKTMRTKRSNKAATKQNERYYCQCLVQVAGKWSVNTHPVRRATDIDPILRVGVDSVSNEPVSGRVFSAILVELGLPMLNKAPALWTIIWDLVAEGSL